MRAALLLPMDFDTSDDALYALSLFHLPSYYCLTIPHYPDIFHRSFVRSFSSFPSLVDFRLVSYHSIHCLLMFAV